MRSFAREGLIDEDGAEDEADWRPTLLQEADEHVNAWEV
jgi:hypothetical protein